MNINDVLRQQTKAAHDWLEATFQGVNHDQAHWKPAGTANTIAASYAHVVTSEDAIVNVMLKGGAPMMATSWAGKTGLSALPPQGDQWFEWGRNLKMEKPAFQKYAQAVYANTDAYIASLKESDLLRKVQSPAGEMTVLQMLGVLAHHARDFSGEISAVKGIQGLKGYPA
ncbi:MAG: DinB family protein [SAR202 cluster bacterium]|nr:DinB family protein [SAR202 cluster bacterium]